MQLPFRVRWQDLKDLFRRSGTVLRADVALTPENRSKGFGTVLFAHDVDAYRAIEMFNGFNWQSRVLDVRLDHQDPTGAIALSMAAQTQPLGVPLPGAANWQHYQQPMMPSLGMPPPPGHLSSFQGLTPQGLPPHMQSTMSQAPSRPTSAASNRPATGTRSRAVSPQPQNVSPMVFANPAPEEQQHRMSSPDPQPFSHQPDLSQPQQSFMPMFMLPPGSVAYPNMGYYVPQTQNVSLPLSL